MNKIEDMPEFQNDSPVDLHISDKEMKSLDCKFMKILGISEGVMELIVQNYNQNGYKNRYKDLGMENIEVPKYPFLLDVRE